MPHLQENIESNYFNFACSAWKDSLVSFCWVVFCQYLMFPVCCYDGQGSVLFQRVQWNSPTTPSLLESFEYHTIILEKREHKAFSSRNISQLLLFHPDLHGPLTLLREVISFFLFSYLRLMGLKSYHCLEKISWLFLQLNHKIVAQTPNIFHILSLVNIDNSCMT